jgi:hypothetical protein
MLLCLFVPNVVVRSRILFARVQLATLVHQASDGEETNIKKFGMLLMSGKAGQLLQQ